MMSFTLFLNPIYFRWWKQHKNQIEDNGDGAVEEAKKHRK